MKFSRVLAFVGFLAATLGSGALGAVATASSVRTWYPTLVKPTWNPPSWVFGPVWTTLYIFMAVAAWRIWRGSESAERTSALRWFWVQLALNAVWSPLFFGLRSPGLALVEIVLLWIAIAVTGVKFLRLDRVAAALWTPYLAWVSFASVLNATIWWLNR